MPARERKRGFPPAVARVGRPPVVGPLTPLLDAVGGTAHLAAQAGVDYGTISRWNRGAHQPSGLGRRVLALLAAQYGLAPPFAADAGTQDDVGDGSGTGD